MELVLLLVFVAGSGALLAPPNENVLLNVLAAVDVVVVEELTAADAAAAPNDMPPNPLTAGVGFVSVLAVDGTTKPPNDGDASTVSALLRLPVSGGDSAVAACVDDSSLSLTVGGAAAGALPNENVAAFGAGAASVAPSAVAAGGWAPNVNCAGPLLAGFSGAGAGALASNATPKLNLLAPTADSDRAAAVLPNGVAGFATAAA